MKKFWTLFLLCTFSMVGAIVANEVVETFPVMSQGKTYKVTVTYSIRHAYYEVENHKLVAEGVWAGSGAQIFNVYAETQDEAETEAKDECSTVCRRHERYIGEKMYNNKKCKVYESRRVESARAE